MAKKKTTKAPPASRKRGKSAKSERSAARSAKSAPPTTPASPPDPPAPKAEAPTAQPQIIPKKTWVQWSGRQYKILDEQAQRYGIPVGDATINLAEVAVWIHDLLAAHGRRILAGDSASEIWDDLENPDREDGGPSSPALERKREVEYQLRLRDLAERDGQLVSRDKVRTGLAAIVSILRHYGDQVQRQFGSDALDLLNDTLADAERTIEQQFSTAAAGREEKHEGE